jgi:hypothetical protein
MAIPLFYAPVKKILQASPAVKQKVIVNKNRKFATFTTQGEK